MFMVKKIVSSRYFLLAEALRHTARRNTLDVTWVFFMKLIGERKTINVNRSEMFSDRSAEYRSNVVLNEHELKHCKS